MTSWKVWPSFKRAANSATGPRRSEYADIYIRSARRANYTPRVARPWRVKKLAWGGMTTFYRNRFYEIDRWYKARIEKPDMSRFPELHIIDPDNHTLSLTERLEKLNTRDAVLNEQVDIGLPFAVPGITAKQKRERSEQRKHLEQIARNRTLEVDLSLIGTDTRDSTWPVQSARLCAHFGIFRHLFHPDAYFHPIIPLQVRFPSASGGESADVHFGNTVFPEQTKLEPSVSYELRGQEEEGFLYTLVLFSPDGNPFEDAKGLLHWMVCNIPGSQVSKGQVLCEYMQATPFRGAGWQRMVFVLFRQDEGRVDLESEGLTEHLAGRPFGDRSFAMAEFYKRLEDELTPAGVAFFQSCYDASVKEFLHNAGLEMPMYDYMWPEPSVKPQDEYPEDISYYAPRVPFNHYLDRYRDPKEVEEELLRKRLKRLSPFRRGMERPSKYPDIFWYDNKHRMSSWQHTESRKENQGWGKYKALYENRIK